MAEANGKYKKFGGINNFSKKNTILVDNLVTNSLYTNVIPSGMSEEAMLWTYDTGSSYEVYTRKRYKINETRIDSSIGDLAGNAVNVSGLTINSDTVNLWPMKTVDSARFDGNYIENRNLQITEISGGLVHGEVSGNTIRAHTYSHIHGTMNLVSGEFAHVHGSGNRVMIEGVGAHVEGSGNSCDISYAHILGRDNHISAVFMNGSKDIIRVASNDQRMNKMYLPHFYHVPNDDNIRPTGPYLSVLYPDYQFSSKRLTICFWLYVATLNDPLGSSSGASYIPDTHLFGSNQGGNQHFINIGLTKSWSDRLDDYDSFKLYFQVRYYRNQQQTTRADGNYEAYFAKNMWHHICLTVDGSGNGQTLVSIYRNGEHMTNTTTSGVYRNERWIRMVNSVQYRGDLWTSPVGESQNGITTIGTDYVAGDEKWGMRIYDYENYKTEMCIGRMGGYPRWLGNGTDEHVKMFDFRYFDRDITQSEVRRVYAGETIGDEVIHLPFDRPDPTYNLGSLWTVLGKKVRNNNNLRCAPVELTESLDASAGRVLIPPQKRGKDIMEGRGYGSLIEGDSIMLGVSSEYVYSLGYMRESDDISGGYMSGVGGANMGIGGYIDANYSIVAGRNNIVSAANSFVGGVSNEIHEGADNAFVYGTEIICPSGNSSAAMFGKYNEIDNPEIDFEGGERMLLSVGNGVSAVQDISFSTWPGDGISLVSSDTYGTYQGSFPDVSRSDVFYVTNKSVGMQKIRVSADVSINSLVLSDSKTSDRYLSFKDGVVTVFNNWDVSMVGIHTSGSITATNFFGDGKYLTGGSDDRGWRIFEKEAGWTIDKYDYYVSAMDISYVKVVDTAFKRDIDIAQLCDIRISSGVGSWDDEISGSEYRNSEYIFTDATSGNGPVKYALDKYDSNETTVGRYYGKGMMTRMTFVPHRKSLVADISVNVCEVGSSGATPLVGNGGIRVNSNETTGNILDVIYTGISDIISYQKPVKKSFDSIFTVDRSSYGNIGYVTQINANPTQRLEEVQSLNNDTTPEARVIRYGGNYFNYSSRLNTPDFTVSFWVKFNEIITSGWDYIVNNRGNGSNNSTGWMSRILVDTNNATKLYFQRSYPYAQVAINIKHSSQIIMNTTDWYHIVLVNDTANKTMKVIIDNQFNMTSNSATHDKISAGDENKEQPYYIGGWGGIAHPGSFYDYRHYDRVLSDAEIVKIYTKGTTFGDEVLRIFYSNNRTNSNYTGTLQKDNPARNFPRPMILVPINNSSNMKNIRINGNMLSGYVPGTGTASGTQYGGSGILLDTYNYYPAIDPLLRQIYVGSENGCLHAYRYTTDGGNISGLWNFYASANEDVNNISVRGIAIGAANRIYMTATNPTEKWGRLYAIDNNSDRSAAVEAWRYEVRSTATKYQVETMPTVDVANNEIYFGDDEGYVRCIQDAGSSYNERWVLDLSAQIATTGALDSNGILYVVQSVPAPSSLFAINTRGSNAGTLRWKYQTILGEAGLSYSSPALDIHDNVYIMTGSDNTSDPNYCHIFKVNDDNGRANLVKHSRLGQFPFDPNIKTSQYVNSSSNTFYFPKDFITSPVIDNDGSVFFTHGYNVVKLNSDLTTIDWNINLNSTDLAGTFELGLTDINVSYIPTSPIISQDGFVYVNAQNKLLAFNTDDGVIDISYTMMGGGITRTSPVMINSRGQWGMHGFDCTRRGKRYPII